MPKKNAASAAPLTRAYFEKEFALVRSDIATVNTAIDALAELVSGMLKVHQIERDVAKIKQHLRERDHAEL